MITLSRTELCAMLPHTGSMCLLDAVQRWDRDAIVCSATSHRDPANPLRRDGVLPAVSGVEYAAQAIGVHGRLVAQKQVKPVAGFLISLRDVSMQVPRLDDAGDVLTVEARRIADTGESVMCEFTLRSAQRELLSGRATLLLEVA